MRLALGVVLVGVALAGWGCAIDERVGNASHRAETGAAIGGWDYIRPTYPTECRHIDHD